MARRLLGADSAATVFNIQEPEEEPAIQEYKVSSFEQRLISEIEYRLERSPVEESDDEVQHGDEPIDNSASPYFEIKLKHYKVFEGMPVTFTCKVTGNPKPKVLEKEQQLQQHLLYQVVQTTRSKSVERDIHLCMHFQEVLLQTLISSYGLKQMQYIRCVFGAHFLA